MHRLEELDGCDLPFGHAPRYRRELLGGRSNKNILIEADSALWVLRISTPNISQFGIDRHAEKIALAKAGEAGIAPRVAFQSLSKGILITEFIDGRHWTPSTLDDSSNLDALVKLVKRVHELDSRLPVTNYYQHAENYWNQLIHRGCDIPASLRKMRTRIIDQCSAEGNVGMRSVLCHRDVSPTNVIERDGRLYLLDWEYATRGASEFDFASIQFEWNVPTERLIVAADLCRSRLRLAAELYEYTCHLWELLNDTLSN